MPPVIAKLIGGAGTGKTAELMNIMDKLIQRYHDPHLIGFVSFTRAARAEAASRAADQFGVKQADLEQGGWFKTLHSICYKCIERRGELLTDNKESREWTQEALQEEVKGGGGSESGDGSEAFMGSTTDADKAIQIWGVARNRLEKLDNVWAYMDATSGNVPDLDYCIDIIERYESAKRMDNRVDFTDLLAQFAGWAFSTHGPYQVIPRGYVPDDIPVWFFDEQQDTSALLDAVCHRLINTDACEFASVAGDPFQSIYGFGGADHRWFMDWDAAKTRVMTKSYRCPPAILQLGEDILSECSDYWDRKIKPADREGEIDTGGISMLDEVDPTESWLLLARTNQLARKMARRLDDAGIPWVPTKGGGGWAAPVRNAAMAGLASLETRGPVDGMQWKAILKNCPSTHDGQAMFVRGTKTEWGKCSDREASEDYGFELDVLPMGGTPEFVNAVRAGVWKQWIPQGESYIGACQQWGHNVVEKPSIRIGTIHSVKGAEADNVALLTTVTGATARAMRQERGADEEQRVWYVGATRARRRLLIVRDPKVQYRKKVPV